MSQPRVLITGIAGFLGSHVADHCLRLGFEVVGADNLAGGFWRNIPTAARFARGDLVAPEFVATLWREHGPFDHVYHLAAYAAEGLSHHVRRYNYQHNLLATVNLINASVTGRVRHFVFTSSIAVYGTGQVPLREDTVPVPEDPYAIAKYACELDLHAAHRVFGLPFTIFRPHNVYGERQNLSDPYRNVVGIFLNLCSQGKSMKVFGDGSQTRAFTHVDDVAPIIARAPLVDGARNATFNVGADSPVSVLELAQEVARAMDVPARIEHLPTRPEVVHAFAEHTRAREVFRPPPPVPLADGLRRMATWLKTVEPAPRQRFEGIEVPDQLPAGWG